HGDVAAAGDDDAAGQLRQVEGLVGGYGVLDPGQVLGHPGPPAGGDQHLLRRAPADLVDLDAVGVHQAGPAVGELRAGVLQVAHVDTGEPGDLLVLLGDEVLPAEAGLADGPAIALRNLEMMREFRGIDHELLGHAAADDAGAADPVLLGDGHPGARHG